MEGLLTVNHFYNDTPSRDDSLHSVHVKCVGTLYVHGHLGLSDINDRPSQPTVIDHTKVTPFYEVRILKKDSPENVKESRDSNGTICKYTDPVTKSSPTLLLLYVRCFLFPLYS